MIFIFKQSGLIKACRESTFTMRDTEQLMLEFIRTHTPPQSCPLAGNSICLDKAFLMKYMPEFMSHLHYRIIDVSSVKELCRSVEMYVFN